MGCFNILYFAILGIIYFLWPEVMAIEGFWFAVGILWFVYFISWLLVGDIADEIAGVNKYKDDDY